MGRYSEVRRTAAHSKIASDHPYMTLYGGPILKFLVPAAVVLGAAWWLAGHLAVPDLGGGIPWLGYATGAVLAVVLAVKWVLRP